jgi:hypothetical protein
MKPLTVQERLTIGLEILKIANRYTEQGKLKEAAEILKGEVEMLARLKQGSSKITKTK